MKRLPYMLTAVVLIAGVGVMLAERPLRGWLNQIATRDVVEIERLEEVTRHSQAGHFRLKAQSVRDMRGISKRQVRHPRGGQAITQETWVVPLVNPGQSPGTEIYAWVTPLKGNLEEGESPDVWFEQLAAGLDNRLVTLRVASRATWAVENGAGWGKAIEEAEKAFHVTSHPDALVFFFP